LRSDQGTQFLAKVIEEFLNLVGVSRRISVAYNHEENGLIERRNKDVLKHLRAVVLDQRLRNKWSTVLPIVQRIVNSQVHSSLGAAPATMVFGSLIDVNKSLFSSQTLSDSDSNPDSTGDVVNVHEYIQKLMVAQSIILHDAAEVQKGVVDRRLNQSQEKNQLEIYQINELVLVLNNEENQFAKDKLTTPWIGPFRVVNYDTVKGIYKLEYIDQSGKFIFIHGSRLKKFVGDVQKNNPVQIAAADKDEYIVEKIVEHYVEGNPKRYKNYQFRVKYIGDDDVKDYRWLSYMDVRNLSALDEYIVLHPDLPFKKG
jgi:hypothetical protein